jgi:2'-5' RNA ligase
MPYSKLISKKCQHNIIIQEEVKMNAAYVVIARFDDEKDKRIRNTQDQLTQAGYIISEWPPHITIAAYEDLDEKLLLDWTSEYTARSTSMKVALNSLSILPPGGEHTETVVICLNPAHSKPFVDFYYGFHAKYEHHCTGVGWYNSITHGRPVFHATIGIVNIKEMQKALELIISQYPFGEAKITALEVYSYPMKLIKRYNMP